MDRLIKVPLCNMFCVGGIDERYERLFPMAQTLYIWLEVCVANSSFGFHVNVVASSRSENRAQVIHGRGR